MSSGRWTFSFSRFVAVALKEFIQMRRDRMTFAMMVGVPIMQLILFGFAINTNPKHLPASLLCQDDSSFARSVVSAMENSSYFKFVRTVPSEFEAEESMRRGDSLFILTIPQDFGRKIVRGETPQLLIEADASDPISVSYALSALEGLMRTALDKDLYGSLLDVRQGAPPVELVTHRRYNEEINTQLNIVPGLMGVILTITMVFITALAVTREKERGTMENLLATPVAPIEVMTGKIAPYILVGYVQITLVLIGAKVLFDVPMEGSIPLLLCLSFFFIAANLCVGVTFSTLAQNQLQAVQGAIFFFLPSLLLSGFMFPFKGMPDWAQFIGNILPLTHYLVIVRGIMLKGCTYADISGHFYAILAFLALAMVVGVTRYRQRLD